MKPGGKDGRLGWKIGGDGGAVGGAGGMVGGAGGMVGQRTESHVSLRSKTIQFKTLRREIISRDVTRLEEIVSPGTTTL